MAWIPRDIVTEAMSVFINAFVEGSSEDIVWSRPPLEFAPTGRGTRICHDSAMINKVSRLREDPPLLKPTSLILYSLPDKQYVAIVAKHMLVGLHFPSKDTKWNEARTWTDESRAARVNQGHDEFRQNVSRARKKIYEKLVPLLA